MIDLHALCILKGALLTLYGFVASHDITRNSWTRNLIFRGLPYTNFDHYIVASMENYALGFLHIAQPTLDKFHSSWHKVRYHHESGT